MLAFLLCVCEPGEEKQITERLQNYKEVTETFVVYGKYDVIGKVEVPDIKALNELISEIRQSETIRMTRTLIVMA